VTRAMHGLDSRGSVYRGMASDHPAAKELYIYGYGLDRRWMIWGGARALKRGREGSNCSCYEVSTCEEGALVV